MRPVTRMTCLLALTLATGTGCFSLGRDTQPVQQYLLGGRSAATDSATRERTSGLTIGLRRLDLAPYLAGSPIVVRRGAHRMVVSEFQRWGEDPVAGINRAVAGYLGTADVIRTVDVAPWPTRSRHDHLVQLHVARFEGVAPDEASATIGEAHLLASWEIIAPSDNAVVARGATEYRRDGWRVGDYPGLVMLLDGGLNVLARDIAACVRTLAAPGPDARVQRAPPVACAAAGT